MKGTKKKQNVRFYHMLADKFPEFALIRSQTSCGNRNPERGIASTPIFFNPNKKLLSSSLMQNDDKIVVGDQQNRSDYSFSYHNESSGNPNRPFTNYSMSTNKSVSPTPLYNCYSNDERLKTPISRTLPRNGHFNGPIVVPALPAVCYKRTKTNNNGKNDNNFNLKKLNLRTNDDLARYSDQNGDNVESTSYPLGKKYNNNIMNDSIILSNVWSTSHLDNPDTVRSMTDFNNLGESDDNETAVNNELKFTDDGVPVIPEFEKLFIIIQTLPESPPITLSPFTFIQAVLTLDDNDFQQYMEDDHLFLKSVTVGNRFDIHSIYDFALSLTENQFSIAISVIFSQFFKLSQIIHWISSLHKCESFTDYATKVEKACESIFLVQKALLFFNIESAKTLINYSNLVKYPYESNNGKEEHQGIIGTCAKEKREIVAPNPMQSIIYNEEKDFPFCEETSILVCEPIILKGKLLGTILLMGKFHKSGAEYCYWPQSELLLLRFFVEHLGKSFDNLLIRSKETARAYRVFGSLISRNNDFAKLLSRIKISFCDILRCENVTVFFKSPNPPGSNNNNTINNVYYYEQQNNKFVKKEIKLEKSGIVQNVFLTKKPINIGIAANDKYFSTEIDGDYKMRPCIAMPIFQQQQQLQHTLQTQQQNSANGTSNDDMNLFGVIICRGKKKGDVVFDEKDFQLFSLLAAGASPCLQSSIFYRKKMFELKLALNAQDRLAMLLQTAESLSRETNIDNLIGQIMTNAEELTGSDRVTMFVVDETKTHLISKIAHGIKKKKGIMIPINAGIAGSVATTGKVINIPDVYEDPRFNANVDRETGYVTKSMMTIPVNDPKGQIIAVAQLMNKLNGEPFSESDVELTKAMCVFSGIALANSKVIEMAVSSSSKMEAMMETAILLMRGQSLSSVIHHIMSKSRDLVNADRNSLFLTNKDSSSLKTSVTVNKSTSINDNSIKDNINNGDNNDFSSNTRNNQKEAQIEVAQGKGIVGFIANTGLVVNIQDAYKDQRFHSGVDIATGYRTRSILGCPIKDGNNQIIGVVEMINKDQLINGGVFTPEDEKLVTAFASFAGLAFEKHNNDSHQPKVAIEISNLITSEENNSTDGPVRIVLSKEKIESYMTNMFTTKMMNPLETVCTIASFFYFLGLTTHFGITNDKLFRFLLAVFEKQSKKEIHTWNRAVESCQFMFYLISSTLSLNLKNDGKKEREDKNEEEENYGRSNKCRNDEFSISKIDQLILLICSLCHDIDHYESRLSLKGIEEPFQILYRNRPIMEMHHCEEIVAILSENDKNILENIKEEDKSRVWLQIFDLILATDPSSFFKTCSLLRSLVFPQNLFNFSNSNHRMVLYKSFMIACDLAPTVNSFDVNREWAAIHWRRKKKPVNDDKTYQNNISNSSNNDNNNNNNENDNNDNYNNNNNDNSNDNDDNKNNDSKSIDNNSDYNSIDNSNDNNSNKCNSDIYGNNGAKSIEMPLEKIQRGVIYLMSMPIFVAMAEIVPGVESCILQLKSNLGKWKNISNIT